MSFFFLLLLFYIYTHSLAIQLGKPTQSNTIQHSSPTMNSTPTKPQSPSPQARPSERRQLHHVSTIKPQRAARSHRQYHSKRQLQCSKINKGAKTQEPFPNTTCLSTSPPPITTPKRITTPSNSPNAKTDKLQPSKSRIHGRAAMAESPCQATQVHPTKRPVSAYTHMHTYTYTYA